MSTLSGINCSCEVVQKDKSVAIGAFSLNGHDSLCSTSAKNAVLTVPTLAQKSTNMQSTYFHYPVGQQYSSCSRLETVWHVTPSSHFISLLKLSSFATKSVTVFATCIMFWHIHLSSSSTSLFHVPHLLILVALMHTHKSLHLSCLSFTRNSVTVHWQTCVTDSYIFS